MQSLQKDKERISHTFFQCADMAIFLTMVIFYIGQNYMKES